MDLNKWYRENIEDPYKGAARDTLGDDVYGIGKDAVTYTTAAATLPITLSSAFVAAPVAIPGYQAYLAKQAGEEAGKRALTAAEWEAELTGEQVRILEEENRRTVSTARARAGASGLSGASSELYISALEETGRQDVEWLKKVGSTAYNARIEEGRASQMQAESQMWGFVGQGVSGVSQTASMFTSLA